MASVAEVKAAIDAAIAQVGDDRTACLAATADAAEQARTYVTGP